MEEEEEEDQRAKNSPLDLWSLGNKTHTRTNTHTHTPPMSNTEQHPRAPSRLALTSLALDCDGRQHQLLSASLCEERGY